MGNFKNYLAHDKIQKLNCFVGYLNVKFLNIGGYNKLTNFWCTRMRACVEKLNVLNWTLPYYIYK